MPRIKRVINIPPVQSFGDVQQVLSQTVNSLQDWVLENPGQSAGASQAQQIHGLQRGVGGALPFGPYTPAPPKPYIPPQLGWYQQLPRGLRDGTNTLFTLDYSLQNPYTILNHNGIALPSEAPYNYYSITSNTLTVLNPPTPTDYLNITYFPDLASRSTAVCTNITFFASYGFDNGVALATSSSDATNAASTDVVMALGGVCGGVIPPGLAPTGGAPMCYSTNTGTALTATLSSPSTYIPGPNPTVILNVTGGTVYTFPQPFYSLYGSGIQFNVGIYNTLTFNVPTRLRLWDMYATLYLSDGTTRIEHPQTAWPVPYNVQQWDAYYIPTPGPPTPPGPPVYQSGDNGFVYQIDLAIDNNPGTGAYIDRLVFYSLAGSTGIQLIW